MVLVPLGPVSPLSPISPISPLSPISISPISPIAPHVLLLVYYAIILSAISSLNTSRSVQR
jgi:hypothetical protein